MNPQGASPGDVPTLTPTPATQPAETGPEHTPTLVPNPSTQRDAKLGRLIAHYEIQRQLGRGGMGIVYEALDTKLNRSVAIKVMRAGEDASPDEIQRFRQEAANVAKLRHVNIVPIHDMGRTEQGLEYFTMDYIDGVTLGDWLRGKRAQAHADSKQPLGQRTLPLANAAGSLGPTLKERVTALEKIALAVQYAHVHGVIHRDLKPGNVMLDAASEPHVLDFGLARVMDKQSGLTVSGLPMGTPSYMPPEQAAGSSREIGPHSDVYSLGAILYEMLVDRPPFTGETAMAVLMAVRHDDPVAPSQLVPRLPRDLETICLKCLEKKSEKRYASAQALAEDLRAWLNGESIAARPATLLERAAKRVRKNRDFYVVSALSIAVLIGLVALSIYRINEERRDALVAQQSAERSLTELIINANRIVDLAPLRKMPLKRLYCNDNQITGLEPLAGMPLEDLECAKNPLASLAGLEKLPLGRLTCSNCQLVDLTPLKNVALNFLNCNANKLGSLSGIEKCPLKWLEADYNSIQTLQPLRGMATLRNLRCEANKLDSLDGLQGLVLTSLFFRKNAVASLEPIRGLPLKSIACSGNKIADLTPLRGMGLEGLDCHDNKIEDLSPLAGMPLESMDCRRNQISSLDALRNMPLKYFLCSENQIKVLDPLQGQPLLMLAISFNEISDLAPLRGMPLATFVGSHNKIHDLTPLAGLPLNTLDVNDNDIEDLAPLFGSKKLMSLWVAHNRITSMEPVSKLPLVILGCSGNSFTSISPLLENTPSGCMAFECASLPDAELKRALVHWSARPETAAPAHDVEVLLALRQHNLTELKRLAVSHTGHNYLMIPIELGWSQAGTFCEQLGGHLATPSNLEELEFIKANFKSPVEFWVGMRYQHDQFSSVGEETSEQVSRTVVLDSLSTSGAIEIGNGNALRVVNPDFLAVFLIEWDR